MCYIISTPFASPPSIDTRGGPPLLTQGGCPLFSYTHLFDAGRAIPPNHSLTQQKGGPYHASSSPRRTTRTLIINTRRVPPISLHPFADARGRLPGSSFTHPSTREGPLLSCYMPRGRRGRSFTLFRYIHPFFTHRMGLPILLHPSWHKGGSLQFY